MLPLRRQDRKRNPQSDSSTLWIVLGAVAAVIVLGGGGMAVLRARTQLMRLFNRGFPAL